MRRTLIKTDDWTSRIVRFVVEFKNVFHPHDEISVILG